MDAGYVFTSSCTPKSTWHTWVTGCPTDSEEDKKGSAKSFFGSAHGWQLTKDCNSITMTGSCPSSGLTIYSRFATISGCLLKCSMIYSTISMQDWRGRAHTTGGPWYLAIKLAVTIRHLAPGDKYSSLQYDFRVSLHAICTFILEVCQAIIDASNDEVLSCPVTLGGWRELIQDFEWKWSISHALGALDDTHVVIRCLPNTVISTTTQGSIPLSWWSLSTHNIGLTGSGHMSDAQISNAPGLEEYSRSCLILTFSRVTFWKHYWTLTDFTGHLQISTG